MDKGCITFGILVGAFVLVVVFVGTWIADGSIGSAWDSTKDTLGTTVMISEYIMRTFYTLIAVGFLCAYIYTSFSGKKESKENKESKGTQKTEE